jgi:hypothetical protein
MHLSLFYFSTPTIMLRRASADSMDGLVLHPYDAHFRASFFRECAQSLRYRLIKF